MLANGRQSPFGLPPDMRQDPAAAAVTDTREVYDRDRIKSIFTSSSERYPELAGTPDHLAVRIDQFQPADRSLVLPDP